LFPVVSYCALGGVARCCRTPISWLYPFIEIFSAVAALALWHDGVMWAGYGSLAMIGRMSAYGILLSGFIVATRTDLEALVVPRIVIAVMGVAGGLASVCGVLPVSGLASCLGSGVGYLSLWGLNYLSRRIVGQDGIGEFLGGQMLLVQHALVRQILRQRHAD
jgi:leader peptidase (prepilin peptidase)/N-methyltransferase